MFCWPLITPNAVELIFVLGIANCTRLKALNASARNCSLIFSVIGVFLKTEMSKLHTPGPRRFGIIRGALPKVNGALKLNTEVSKNFNKRFEIGPLSDALAPLQFGRCVPAKLPLPF